VRARRRPRRGGLAAAAAWAGLLAVAPAAALEPERARCADHTPLRRPFFGDTHVHSAFSFDANALGVRNTPSDAYRFAKGLRVGLQPYDAEGRPLRTVELARPLDFAVVTDHAGLLGEVHICATPGAPGHDSLVCRLVRRWPLLAYYVVSSRAFNTADPVRYGFCGPGGRLCRDAAQIPWRRIQTAAEAHTDRSPACRFTTFVGYEWTGGPDGDMIHRNVIFRNAAVPASPVSYFEEEHPQGLWRRLRAECLEAGTGCDVLAIPHNPNLSGGRLFRAVTEDGTPLDREDALWRAAMEPVVEIMQHKGDSECRLAGGAEDELCGFEKLPFARMDVQRFPFLWEAPPRGSYVREALGEGLVQAERIGANPFRLGILAATDTHVGTPGLVSERGYPGHGAGGDTSRVETPIVPDSLHFNPGGLAGVWAEENSREALFAALRRREVYGTSGPRIAVRFFGGWGLPEDLCERPDLPAVGYAEGVPMGGLLPAAPGAPDAARAPAFAVAALRDPGAPGSPGAPLQRAQVVKIHVEDGAVRVRVLDVAGDPENGASVDPRTCERRGPGFDRLCRVWRDPDFDPDERALYYVRVVENPSCRWSTHVCRANGVDCSDPGALPRELRPCCDPGLPASIQERAWTSPIWYDPPGAGAVAAEGAGP